MPSYKATHIPYGITDLAKRTIVNPGIKDKVEFLKYGIETGGEHFSVRVLINPGGGQSYTSIYSPLHAIVLTSPCHHTHYFHVHRSPIAPPLRLRRDPHPG